MRSQNEFLKFMDGLGNTLDEIFYSPRPSIHSMYVPRSTFDYRMKKFEKAGLVKKQKSGKKVSFQLTEKGKSLIRQPKAINNRRNDGLSTVIIFDIPEAKRRERTIFRRYLVKNGFTQIQESVLISHNRLSKELKELIHELGLKRCITFLSARIDRFEL